MAQSTTDDFMVTEPVRQTLTWWRSWFVETADLRSSVVAWRQEHVQEPTGSLKGSPAGYPARDFAGELEKHPDHTFKSDQDAVFDGSVSQEVDFAGH